MVVAVLNAVLADGGVPVVDRSEGASGGPAQLILIAMNLAVLAVVWLAERRRRPLSPASPAPVLDRGATR